MPDPIRILIAGDFCPRSATPAWDPFADNLRELFKKADYTIVNLEAPLTDAGKPILKTGRNFRISPQYAEILKQAGIDCVTLANNHIRDFGDEGVLDTIKNCKNAGLDFAGAGADSLEAAQPLIKEIRGYKIAILNYCEREFSIAGKHHAGANPWDLIDAYRQIESMRRCVDKVFMIYHGGLEYQHFPTPNMVKEFRFMIDAGADAIIAHHTHAYSGYELYSKKPIFYGLGNLLSTTSARSPRQNWYSGLLACISIDKSELESHACPVSMSMVMKSVEITNLEESKSIKLHVDQLGDQIQNDMFIEYWDDKYGVIGDKALNDFTSISPLIKKLRKFLGIKRTYMSEYRTLVWLNHFRCAAHREKMIAILERKYDNLVSKK